MIQKTDISRSSTRTSSWDVALNTNAGLNKVYVDNLPAGTYAVNGLATPNAIALTAMKLYGLTATFIDFGNFTSSVNASISLRSSRSTPRRAR